MAHNVGSPIDSDPFGLLQQLNPESALPPSDVKVGSVSSRILANTEIGTVLEPSGLLSDVSADYLLATAGFFDGVLWRAVFGIAHITGQRVKEVIGDSDRLSTEEMTKLRITHCKATPFGLPFVPGGKVRSVQVGECFFPLFTAQRETRDAFLRGLKKKDLAFECPVETLPLGLCSGISGEQAFGIPLVYPGDFGLPQTGWPLLRTADHQRFSEIVGRLGEYGIPADLPNGGFCLAEGSSYFGRVDSQILYIAVESLALEAARTHLGLPRKPPTADGRFMLILSRIKPMETPRPS